MAPRPEFEKITARIKTASRDGSSLDAAQVKIIGLDEIREAAGARWPRMQERVRAGSLEILSQHAGPDDAVIPCGDGFLVILAHAAPGSAPARCQAMREALLKFYLGDDALQSLRPDVRSQALTADGLTELLATGVSAAPAASAQRVVARGCGEIGHVRIFSAHDRQLGPALCAPVMRERGGRRLGYNPEFVLDGKHTKPDFLELDIAVLDEALTLASDAKAAGRSYVLGLSVHATTMQRRKSRETYLSWLTDIDPDLRRHLFVTILEIEKGTPLISIAEWTAALRTYFGRVWLDFHYTDHAVANLGGAGAWAAGFHLPTYRGVQEGPRAQRLLEQVAFWTRSMHSQNLKLLVNGFHDAAFLTAAEELGVDFATGDTLWPFEFNDREPLAAAS